MQCCKKTKISHLGEVIELINSEEFDKSNYHWLASDLPKKCFDGPCVLGVDEAGRGPVLGPMVYAVCYCPLRDVEIIKSIGCTDSKTLTQKRREELFGLINGREDIGWAADVISPNFISNKMLKRAKYSLNEIAQNSTIKLIESVLEKNINVEEIYVDTVGPPEKYQMCAQIKQNSDQITSYDLPVPVSLTGNNSNSLFVEDFFMDFISYKALLSKVFPKCKVTVEKKADLLYPVVGAASICAKVIRDTVVENWNFSELINVTEKNFGTGYPGDPKSKQFLSEVRDDIFGFPNFVRFSWSTSEKLLEELTHVEWEDERKESERSSKNIPKLFNYFSPASDAKHKSKFRFFKERCLNSAETF